MTTGMATAIFAVLALGGLICTAVLAIALVMEKRHSKKLEAEKLEAHIAGMKQRSAGIRASDSEMKQGMDNARIDNSVAAYVSDRVVTDDMPDDSSGYIPPRYSGVSPSQERFMRNENERIIREMQEAQRDTQNMMMYQNMAMVEQNRQGQQMDSLF